MVKPASIGILGGFGPIPTAELYTTLCESITPRPYILIESPSIEKAAERVMIRSWAESSTKSIVFKALQELQSKTFDVITIPSVTVMSLILSEGISDDRFPDWFNMMNDEIRNVSGQRVGLIATTAVFTHSSLTSNLRKQGIDVIVAPHVSDAFEEWVLSCEDRSKAQPPPRDLVKEYEMYFANKSVDTCVLACTEACLFESVFAHIGVNRVNAFTVLLKCIKSKIIN